MASRRELLLGVLLACADPPAGAPPDATPTPGDTADPCVLWTWETVGAPFTHTWCTPCHAAALRGPARAGAPVGVDLDTEDDVRKHLDRFVARALVDPPTMPPASVPPADERARASAWAACLTP